MLAPFQPQVSRNGMMRIYMAGHCGLGTESSSHSPKNNQTQCTTYPILFHFSPRVSVLTQPIPIELVSANCQGQSQQQSPKCGATQVLECLSGPGLLDGAELNVPYSTPQQHTRTSLDHNLRCFPSEKLP